MKTYSGPNAGSTLEPLLWNARKVIWLISPWLGKDYAKQLASLSQQGIEVRIITSNVNYNGDSLEILKSNENPNLILLVVDKQKVGFIHSKIYIVDNNKAICGSANLTYSGLNSNVESLSIAENENEIQQIEHDFMRIWLDFERKRMSKEELITEKQYSLTNALPLSVNYGEIDYPNIKKKELFYYPYYVFEYSLRASVGKSPPVLFENSGLILLDGITREIVHDKILSEEIMNSPIKNYKLRTRNKFELKIQKQKIRDFREAKEIAIDYIIKQNTENYTQHYGTRVYERIFVPYRRIIRFIRSDYIQIPVWHIERHEPDGRKHEDLVLGASGKKWDELLFCPECEKKVWIDDTEECQNCGIEVCPDCIKTVGLIFKKKLCTTCAKE
jgi:HKD family nuclease